MKLGELIGAPLPSPPQLRRRYPPTPPLFLRSLLCPSHPYQVPICLPPLAYPIPSTIAHIPPQPRRPILPASGEMADVLLTLFRNFPCPSHLARRMGNTSAGLLPPRICHADGRRAPYSVPPCASQLARPCPHSVVLPLTVACCPLVAQEIACNLSEPPWPDDSHLLLRSLPETQVQTLTRSSVRSKPDTNFSHKALSLRMHSTCLMNCQP